MHDANLVRRHVGDLALIYIIIVTVIINKILRFYVYIRTRVPGREYRAHKIYQYPKIGYRLKTRHTLSCVLVVS